MPGRPDKPLVVRCSFSGSKSKKIIFASARNCPLDILRAKVEQSYSLFDRAHTITYKDDDGEVVNINSDTDLTDAIEFFAGGSDDATSILSGRSFGQRKVTLRVDILVDYDGPSLSDTSSLISLDDRNNSQQSFSFGPSVVDPDDDSVTVSSRDNGGMSIGSNRFTPPVPDRSAASERPSGVAHSANSSRLQPSSSELEDQTRVPNFSSGDIASAAARYPADPNAVFARLKLEESIEEGSDSGRGPLEGNGRGAVWLREQKQRRAVLFPEPSISNGGSTAPDASSQLPGDLKLKSSERGTYYYDYTSAGSVSQSLGYVFDSGGGPEVEPSLNMQKPRPSSMQLNWLASQQVQSERRLPKLSLSVPSLQTHRSDPLPSAGRHKSWGPQPYIALSTPPPEMLTDCSHCGVLLENIRYVCNECGPKRPIGEKGRGKNPFANPDHVYPPPARLGSLPGSSSHTFVGSSEKHPFKKPTPSINSTRTSNSINTLQGYELCFDCLQDKAIDHAIESSSPEPRNAPPSSPEDDQSAWRRSAPKRGHLRHAYQENVWGDYGWEEVEHDEIHETKCTLCAGSLKGIRYKCVSCPRVKNMCRACYGQVHELHPSHPFLVFPDKFVRSHSEPQFYSSTPQDFNEQSLVHPGVRCTHCLQEIIGARFHCAICIHESIDICSNCESAGLPGNLDSADNGHSSSHIMIKIPRPLESTELETMSLEAKNRWTDRDAPSIGGYVNPSAKTGSVVSGYGHTIIGNGTRTVAADDHLCLCNGCNRPIIGVRYQCANCPSSPTAFNLCASCEERSYTIHDPRHSFFKFPRPVQRPLELPHPLPLLYKHAAGPLPGPPNPVVPKAYLRDLLHQSAVCDRCMESIRGEWFRCAYCPWDLCDNCEPADTHNNSHVFLVFKSLVDMQALRNVSNVSNFDNQRGGPPLIPYDVYL